MTVGAIRRIVTAVAVLAAATVLVGSAQEAAQAANPPVGSFPVWTQPTASTFSGQLSTAAGGGTIAVTTTASNARVADTGQAAFLGAQTGFGQKFGSSRYQSYLTIGLAPRVPPASHGADSLTTVTLPTLPVGWGFAVGDIDADQVSIDASGPGGGLSAADLNPQDTGGTPILNYCSNAAPKPSGCGAGTTFTDHPWWCATPGAAPCATATLPRTVVGNGVDTSGAYDWFVPTVSVSTLTFTCQWLSGIPTFQLWIVVPSAATVVSGHLDVPTGAPSPTLSIEHGDGSPVLDLLSAPLVVPVASDGGYTFTTEVGDYRLQVDPPAGYQAAGTSTVAFTASGDAISLPTLSLAAVLPATGTDAAPLFAAAASLLVLGVGLNAGLLLLRRSRRRRRA
jgi:LPXTG-motif cell wall-anchored protein